MVDLPHPKVPVQHINESEHRRLLANRTNADLRKAMVQARDSSGTSYGAGPTDVSWNSEIFDTSEAFDGTSFTAPRDGKYLFTFTLTHTATITISDVWLISLVTSNRTYTVRVTVGAAVSNTVTGAFLADMDINDTAKMTIQRASGTGNFILTTTADENTFCLEESVPFK